MLGFESLSFIYFLLACIVFAFIKYLVKPFSDLIYLVFFESEENFDGVFGVKLDPWLVHVIHHFEFFSRVLFCHLNDFVCQNHVGISKLMLLCYFYLRPQRSRVQSPVD